MDAFHLTTLVQNINVLVHKVDSEGKRRQMILPFSSDRIKYYTTPNNFVFKRRKRNFINVKFILER